MTPADVSRRLERVVIERRTDGGWDVLRERIENGERFVCDDLQHAFDVVLAAYQVNGEPRLEIRIRKEE